MFEKYTSISQAESPPALFENLPETTKQTTQDLAHNIDDDRSWKHLGRSTILFAGLSVILAACCMALTIALMRDYAKLEDSKTAFSAAGLAEEINGLIPNFPLTAVSFKSNASLALDSTEEPSASLRAEVDMNWEDLTPAGGGFVHVNDTGGRILPPGLVLSKSHPPFHVISVFHQIHCLNALRSALSSLFFEEPLTQQRKHIFHCVEYLRQVVMCHGDTALEGHLEPNRTGTEGWGTTHICKDWDTVYKYGAEEGRSAKEYNHRHGA